MASATNSISKRKGYSLYDEVAYSAMGFVDLADYFTVGDVACSLLERRNPGGEGWQYVLLATDRTGVERVMNAYEDTTVVPGIRHITDMLLASKLLKKEPRVDREWSVAFYCEHNDFWSSFPHPNLRDRAVDEAVLFGEYLYSKSVIERYEIDGQGSVSNTVEEDVPEWVKSRDLFALECEHDYSGAQARLMLSLLLEDVEEIRAALSAGADPMQADSSTRLTPMHKMAWRGNAAIVRALIEHGAELDAKDSKGNAPIHLAASRGHKHVCVELWNAGAKLGETNIGSLTAVDEAAQNKHLETETLLRSMVSRQLAMDVLGDVGEVRWGPRP